MTAEAKFKCMRCGHLYTAPYSPTEPMVERACPRCKSNSIRRLKEKKPVG
jgi:predicted  nucleic acid-binding Zn-ribbon protein